MKPICMYCLRRLPYIPDEDAPYCMFCGAKRVFKISKPYKLPLTDNKDLPNFTSEFPVNTGNNIAHVDALKKRMPLIGGEKIKPIPILPDEANGAS